MHRSAIQLILLTPLTATAFGQTDLRHRLRATGPVKTAGVYHVSTGTWTRAGASKAELGPAFRTIYNNTCSTLLLAAIYPNETWTDEGRLPTGGVTPLNTANVFNADNSPDKLYDQTQLSVWPMAGFGTQCPTGPASARGSARGSATSYTVDAFTIGYCSDLPGPLSVPAGTGARLTVDFRDSTSLDVIGCADDPFVAPAPIASFSLVNFPGAGAAVSSCWLVAIDLTGGTASFTMRSDGNGQYGDTFGVGDLGQDLDTELDDCFSWSFSFPGIAMTTQPASGMLVAGAPADAAHLGWVTAMTIGGGFVAAAGGYDGTVWDHQEANAAPVYATNGVVTNANGAEGTLVAVAFSGEAGTGMSTQDAFRIDLNPATSVSSCYYFGLPGGTSPFASFHLKLHTLAATNVTPVSPASGFCFGDSCAFTCPCAAPNPISDPSGGHESGCANSNPLALVGALGGRLEAEGSTVVSALPAVDTLRFRASGLTVGLAFLVKGNAKTPNGVFPATADGVRCASGALVRFGAHNAGSNGDAVGTWSYPNTAQTTTISSATAQTAGVDAFYQLFYRNPAPWCSDAPTATTNFTNAQQVRW